MLYTFNFIVSSQKKYHFFPGIYIFECWCAEGWIGMSNGKLIWGCGKWAYTFGKIQLKTKTDFFLYFGEKGKDCKCST